MSTLESLRRQLETATDLAAIVSTMKTLAAVSIHQYERAVEALQDYNRTIELGFQIILRRDTREISESPQSDDAIVLVFGSSQGMCGQFNEQIANLLDETFHQQSPHARWHLLAVGTKLLAELNERRWEPEHAYETPSSVADITELVQTLLPRIEALRTSRNVRRLLLFYNQRATASSYESTRLQLLPISAEKRKAWHHAKWPSNSLPCFFANRESLLSELIQQYLFVSLFTASAESLASENASRIAAMQAAEKNIEERLDTLRTRFNQQRQTAITEELLDVVSGFEALTSGRDD